MIRGRDGASCLLYPHSVCRIFVRTSRSLAREWTRVGTRLDFRITWGRAIRLDQNTRNTIDDEQCIWVLVRTSSKLLSIQILIFNPSTLLSLSLHLLRLICFLYLLLDPCREQDTFTFVHPHLLGVKHRVKHRCSDEVANPMVHELSFVLGKIVRGKLGVDFIEDLFDG